MSTHPGRNGWVVAVAVAAAARNLYSSATVQGKTGVPVTSYASDPQRGSPAAESCLAPWGYGGSPRRHLLAAAHSERKHRRDLVPGRCKRRRGAVYHSGVCEQVSRQTAVAGRLLRRDAIFKATRCGLEALLSSTAEIAGQCWSVSTPAGRQPRSSPRRLTPPPFW